MYLNSSDHQSIWQLAHIWTGTDSHASDPNALPPDVKVAIHRLLVAIRNKLISVRTTSHVILNSDSLFDGLFELSHHIKINACLKRNRFMKDYLDSLYVWRPEVIRWCINDHLDIPSVWQLELDLESPNEDDTENGRWYEQLTDRKKQIAGALHIASRLWKDNVSLSYEDVYNHGDMKKYDKSRTFSSLASFKEWARDIAPKEAKSPGRRSKTKV